MTAADYNYVVDFCMEHPSVLGMGLTRVGADRACRPGDKNPTLL
jgi:hypothetical protein